MVVFVVKKLQNRILLLRLLLVSISNWKRIE